MAPSPPIPAGSGAGYATDYYLYVTDDNARCGASTLASAGVCQIGTGNRPVLGILNICDLMFTKATEVQAVTLLHELTHALVRGQQAAQQAGGPGEAGGAVAAGVAWLTCRCGPSRLAGRTRAEQPR